MHQAQMPTIGYCNTSFKIFTIVSIEYKSNLLRTYNQQTKHIAAHKVLLSYAQALLLSAANTKAIY